MKDKLAFALSCLILIMGREVAEEEARFYQQVQFLIWALIVQSFFFSKEILSEFIGNTL